MPTEYVFVLILFLFGIVAILFAKMHGLKMHAKGLAAGKEEIRQFVNASTHQARLDEFESLSHLEKKRGIVFLGDSLTQGYNVYEYYPQLPVYNRGIYGDTTVGCASRLQQSVYALRPKGVVMLIGVNDLSVFRSTPHEIATRIEEMAQSIRAQLPDVTIWVLSLLPVSKEKHPQINAEAVGVRENRDIEEVNRRLQQSDCFHYLDVNHALKDEAGNLKRAYTQEGIHLSAKGYEALTKELSPILESWAQAQR